MVRIRCELCKKRIVTYYCVAQMPILIKCTRNILLRLARTTWYTDMSGICFSRAVNHWKLSVALSGHLKLCHHVQRQGLWCTALLITKKTQRLLHAVAILPVGDGYGEVLSGGPLKVMSTKCGVRDPEIQVLMFDIEALICNLLTEENPLLGGNYQCRY